MQNKIKKQSSLTFDLLCSYVERKKTFIDQVQLINKINLANYALKLHINFFLSYDFRLEFPYPLLTVLRYDERNSTAFPVLSTVCLFMKMFQNRGPVVRSGGMYWVETLVPKISVYIKAQLAVLPTFQKASKFPVGL